MIVTKQGNRNDLAIIRHDEHDDQCGFVARQWGNEQFDQLLNHEAVSLAVENHDHGWTESDDVATYDPIKKRPMNFMDANLKQHVEFYEKGYKHILGLNRYSGLLHGMHWVGLYTSRYGYDPTFTYHVPDDLTQFMDDLIHRLEKEFAEIKLEYWKTDQPRNEFEDHIWMGYEFFQVMDRMSLFLAHTGPKMENEVVLGPIRPSLKAEPVHLTLKAKGNGTVIVDPFPFKQPFETIIPTRYIEDREYANQEDGREAIAKAPVEEVVWKVLAK